MITKKIIEKIEGEAEVFFEKQNEQISFATISFTHMRGFSNFLKEKPALDTLVYTPRICGICGHSHLYATVRALENAYTNSSIEPLITQKAHQTRELTLSLEIIQNHIKWIYLTALPQLFRFKKIPNKTNLQGLYASALAGKIIALFSGQYPHNSYMIPGGITSDFTYIEITKAMAILEELILFLETKFLGCTIEHFLSFESCKKFNTLSMEFSFFEKTLMDLQMHTKGFGADRFLSLASHTFTTQAKVKKTTLQKADQKFVTTRDAFSPHKTTYAQNALYKNEFIEVGPLARAMANTVPLIKNIHRRYKDSTYTRAIARIYELSFLTLHVKKILQNLQVDEASYIKPPNIKKITAEGIGIVEAPRGTLIHRIMIEKGIIKQYEIITPTQFNLASSTKQQPAIVQNAMKHLTEDEATFIFRTFDVCSVCTTH